MTIKIAIIGSGPSAFYAAEELFKSGQNIRVDMFEKLPTPFGLLRGGVAPDHQQMKTISKSYEKIASNEQFYFFGNITIGKDITIKELMSHYHAIIVATGAESDRKMNIPGEACIGSHTATEFVAWYNGQPSYQDRKFDLSKSNAVVIGQGNVAVDVTRILAKSTEALKTTDITNNALKTLEKSNIKNIYMVGRRGPVQAAFTELELKELGAIDGVNIIVHNELDISETDKAETELSSKTRKNMAQLLELKNKKRNINAIRTIHLLFYSSPVKIIENQNKIKKIQFEKNELKGEPGQQKAIPNGEYFELDCDILFRSIGYLGLPLEDLPFDEKKGIIPNNAGQVMDENGNNIDGVFTTGWIKRGPSGVIGTNRGDSKESVKTCLTFLSTHKIKEKDDVFSLLEKKNIRYLTYNDWKKIDAHEVKEGEKIGKPREKCTSVEEIFDILKK